MSKGKKESSLLYRKGDDDNEKKLLNTVIFIEATSFERYSLWLQNKEKYEWITDNCGFMRCVGSLGKTKPICVSFNFAKINDVQICFYEATSRFVDHTLIQDYLRKFYPDRKLVDATNFTTNP